MNLGRKLLTSLLTIIMFSLAASLVSMSETYDFGFYIAVYPIYAAPLIFLIGLPLSILVDFLVNKIRITNHVLYLIIKLMSYACAGFVGMYIFCLIMGAGIDVLMYKETIILTLFGVFAAMIFVLVDLGLEALFKARKKQL
ncbi:preprotein translocase subunit SecE [Paenibacillus sp. PvP094]